MKYLRAIFCFSLLAFSAVASLARADDSDKSVRILVAKANDTTAKVTIGTQTYLVPLSFEDNTFSWNDVKDGYNITPAFASYIAEDRGSIYIGCSGAAFRAARHAKN